MRRSDRGRFAFYTCTAATHYTGLERNGNLGQLLYAFLDGRGIVRLRLVFILLCVTAAWGQRGGAGAPSQGVAGTVGQQRASTQMVTDPKLLCTLEGQVLNASTGEPVQRATLSLASSGLRGNVGGGQGGWRRQIRQNGQRGQVQL